MQILVPDKSHYDNELVYKHGLVCLSQTDKIVIIPACIYQNFYQAITRGLFSGSFSRRVCSSVHLSHFLLVDK